ncbi:hypothetical protein, partial [Enterobacter cloacae]|uniref:hypothetical protein n=1 Tax=Enterobacter cloacae TaxID=550 RepID=UPI0019543F97
DGDKARKQLHLVGLLHCADRGKAGIGGNIAKSLDKLRLHALDAAAAQQFILNIDTGPSGLNVGANGVAILAVDELGRQAV